MFCKFCGKQIDPATRVCPKCGERQEDRCGGNGFWDILTSPSRTTPPEKIVPVPKRDVPDAPSPVKKFPKSAKTARIQWLSLGIAFFCLVYTFAGNLTFGARLRKLESRMETVLDLHKNQAVEVSVPTYSTESQMPLEETAYQETEPTQAVLETTLPPAANVPIPAPIFLQQPEDALWTGQAVFSLTLCEDVKAEKIAWQYQDADGTWCDVDTSNELIQVTEDAPQYTLQIMDTSLVNMKFHCVIDIEGMNTTSREVQILSPSGSSTGVEG